MCGHRMARRSGHYELPPAWREPFEDLERYSHPLKMDIMLSLKGRVALLVASVRFKVAVQTRPSLNSLPISASLTLHTCFRSLLVTTPPWRRPFCTICTSAVLVRVSDVQHCQNYVLDLSYVTVGERGALRLLCDVMFHVSSCPTLWARDKRKTYNMAGELKKKHIIFDSNSTPPRAQAGTQRFGASNIYMINLACLLGRCAGKVWQPHCCAMHICASAQALPHLPSTYHLVWVRGVGL